MLLYSATSIKMKRSILTFKVPKNISIPHHIWRNSAYSWAANTTPHSQMTYGDMKHSHKHAYTIQSTHPSFSVLPRLSWIRFIGWHSGEGYFTKIKCYRHCIAYIILFYHMASICFDESRNLIGCWRGRIFPFFIDLRSCELAATRVKFQKCLKVFQTIQNEET
jgi:hypothetical protein